MKKNLKGAFTKTLVLGILIPLITVYSCWAQTKAEKMDQLMKQYVEIGKFNGSILVSENGQVIYKKGWGMANMEWNIPNRPDTKHRLGSVTKQFTAMAVLQLVERGELDLKKTISSYLPEYPKQTGDQITIHHLLTHTSGIPNYTSFPMFFEEKSREAYTTEGFIKMFADSALHFEPGEKFEYSNSGYFLLGAIIEKVTGKPYEKVVKDGIFTPLEMVNSGYDHHETILPNRASGYEMTGTGFRNADYLNMSVPYAAGSLYSTVEDLYRWDQALYTDQLLSETYRGLLFESYTPAWAGAYGYGWFILSIPMPGRDPLIVQQHDGGINGFHTVISRIPSEKHMIVMLNNTGGTVLNDINMAINAILHDLPYGPPAKSLAESLWKIISTEGVGEGKTWFEENKDDPSYTLNENEMNGLGYHLLGSGLKKEAIVVFELNVMAFPKSWNVFDSLAEAHLKDGNEELAIANYKKSVKLNPKNTGGKEMLKKLAK